MYINFGIRKRELESVVQTESLETEKHRESQEKRKIYLYEDKTRNKYSYCLNVQNTNTDETF